MSDPSTTVAFTPSVQAIQARRGSRTAYARLERRRFKLWGRARVVEDDPVLLARLVDPAYEARPEQAIVFTLDAWDRNCPQHIPLRFDAAEVASALDTLKLRVEALERENRSLRARLAERPPPA